MLRNQQGTLILDIVMCNEKGLTYNCVIYEVSWKSDHSTTELYIKIDSNLFQSETRFLSHELARETAFKSMLINKQRAMFNELMTNIYPVKDKNN